MQALVSLSTVLEVLQDSVGGRSARGYSLTGGAVSYAAVPASGAGGGGGGLRRKLFLCGPCGSASGGQVGGAPLLLPHRKPDLTIHVHEQGRDVTVLGRLF